MAPGTYPNGRITNSRCGKQSRTAVDRYSYTDKTTSRDDSSMFVSFYDSIRFFSIETFPFFVLRIVYNHRYNFVINTLLRIQEPEEKYLID